MFGSFGFWRAMLQYISHLFITHLHILVPNLSFATKVNSNPTLSLKGKELCLPGFMDRRKPSARSLHKPISAFLDFIYILMLFHNYFAYQQMNSPISLQTLKHSAVKKVKFLKKK
jgi:hypothetical protein